MRMRALSAVAVAGAAVALLGYAVYVEFGGPAEQSTARARGCVLCHGQGAFVEGVSRLKSGEPLRPLLAERLQEAHPVLSRGSGVVDELVDFLLPPHLAALAEHRAGSPGRVLYLSKCAACHGRDGAGTPGEYPPLQGSEWLTEEPGRLPEILSQGLKGPIRVRGEEWDKSMLAPGIAEPAQVQQLIDYLRREWGK